MQSDNDFDVKKHNPWEHQIIRNLLNFLIIFAAIVVVAVWVM